MFKNGKPLKFLAAVLCVTLIVSISACGKPAKKYNMTLTETERKQIFVTNEDDKSKVILLPKHEIDDLYYYIDSIKVLFPYSELFETEECYKRLQTKVFLQNHNATFKSFDELNPNALTDAVKRNNTEHLKTNTFGLEAPSDDYILELSKLIIDTILKLKESYADIDYNRVLCNLSNLKILYKKGMVDNAQVTADMVLHVSPNMFEIVDLMSGENGCRNVVIHEIMHIIQMGCHCENIEHCTRRCGFSYRWDDFEMNSSDFGWLFEGSAERMMCNLTSDVALTYKYMINYICTMNLTTIMKQDVPANYLETLSFYDNADKLYELFDCKNKTEKTELLNTMIAINIIQMAPDTFLSVYATAYEKDINNTSTIDDINYSLKPYVCLYFTKQFYKQTLDAFSSSSKLTTNDLLFLINLFEASIDNHLKYTNDDYLLYNQSFVETYLNVRNRFFEVISKYNGIDILSQYESYNMLAGKTKINASLKWLEKDKIDFLIERFEYLEFNRNSKIQ